MRVRLYPVYIQEFQDGTKRYLSPETADKLLEGSRPEDATHSLIRPGEPDLGGVFYHLSNLRTAIRHPLPDGSVVWFIERLVANDVRTTGELDRSNPRLAPGPQGYPIPVPHQPWKGIMVGLWHMGFRCEMYGGILQYVVKSNNQVALEQTGFETPIDFHYRAQTTLTNG